METSYLKTLELDKIIARAAEGCVCKEARAMLLAIEPQCDPDEVRYALEQTDAINTLLIKNGSPRFGGVEGVSQLAARAVKGGVLSMGELLMVAGALRNFQHLTSWYGSSEHDALPTDDLFYALAPEPGLEQQISSAILAPDAMADTASRTLAELRKKIRATENSIRDRLESMVRNMDTSKYLQESVVSMRNGRYVVPVKSEYRGEVSGIIHDVSSTGATVFVEPQAVVEANARILQYRAQEAQEIERILVAFTAQVAAIEPQFQYSYKAMLEIDILLAKARLALELKAFKPAVRTDSSFNLIRARHPLIDPQKCVPVDIALGGEYDSLIITGPNTGGKTVTLKTAGLLCAMAQCGFLIPADERSEICVFDEFLVDIGDEQSIEQSLSTFSGHMKKITGILELAMPHTLVLLDELGAGTDPAEGAALAVAIIEELRRRGVLLMATTHYAELKVFALETKGVVNASCEFDLETLRPTYKLSVGVPGKSNAFLISEKLGIPSRVIEAAQQHLSAEDKRLDAVLGQLDDLKLQLKESQNEVEQLRNEASHQLEAARKKRDELIQQGENELEAARAKARAHVVQPFIGDVCVCRIRGHGQGFAGPDRVLVQRCTADDRRLGGRQELGHHIAGVAVDADSAPRPAVLQHRHLRADAVGADDAVIRARARAHPHRLAVAGGHIRGVRAGRRGRGDVRHRQELRHHIACARANANFAPVRAADEHLYLRAHVVGRDDAVIGGRAGAHPDGLAVRRVDIRRTFGGGRAAVAARHGQVVAVHKAVMSIRREDIVPFAGCADDGHLRAGEVGGNRFGGCGSLRAQPQPSALNDCRRVILRTRGDNQHRNGNQHCQNQ